MLCVLQVVLSALLGLAVAFQPNTVEVAAARKAHLDVHTLATEVHLAELRQANQAAANLAEGETFPEAEVYNHVEIAAGKHLLTLNIH